MPSHRDRANEERTHAKTRAAYAFLFSSQGTIAHRDIALGSASRRPGFIVDKVQAIDLLQRIDSGFDVRVFPRRCFHDSLHCQSMENVFKHALQGLRLLLRRDVEAPHDPEIFTPSVLIAVLVGLFLLLVVASFVLEVRASAAQHLIVQKDKP